MTDSKKEGGAEETLQGKPETPGPDDGPETHAETGGESGAEETPADAETSGKVWDLEDDGTGSGARPGEADKDKEIAELKEKTLRVYAELENYKKRTKREKAEHLRYANEGLLKELLPVLDNLDRAIEHMKEAPEVSNWTEGVELTRRQCLDALKKFGVAPIESLGEGFDPARHQAMTFIETTDHPENTVAEEFQKGYLYHERVLRPSMVAVARKPSGEGPPTETEGGDGEGPREE